MSDVTRILSRIAQGDPTAAEQLLPLVYDELRKLAARHLTQEKPGQTLQATALVHQAYIRLVTPPGDEGGIELWDVTDPLNAVLLSRVGPNPAIPPFGFAEMGVGVHNTFLYQKGERAFVLAAVTFGEAFQTEFGLPITGDLRIIEITDPDNPVEIASWGIKQDLDDPYGATVAGGRFFGEDCSPRCRGDNPGAFLHDVWANVPAPRPGVSAWRMRQPWIAPWPI